MLPIAFGNRCSGRLRATPSAPAFDSEQRRNGIHPSASDVLLLFSRAEMADRMRFGQKNSFQQLSLGCRSVLLRLLPSSA